jgi:glycerophosphoryl diester phosphodiesterase
MTPKIVAHRGASKAERENTLAAFTTAKRMGADMVELDVRRTNDGCMVVHHDPMILGLGVISNLQRHDLPTYVPDLNDALDACNGIDVNVEIKSDKGEPDYDPSHRLTLAVIELLLARADRNQMLISSFDADVLRLVRRDAPLLRTGFLFTVTAAPSRLIQRCAHDGYVAIHPYAKSVTRGLVDMAHGAGLAVNTWTVDDPKRMQTLAEWGVDAIITNVPDVARVALGR